MSNAKQQADELIDLIESVMPIDDDCRRIIAQSILKHLDEYKPKMAATLTRPPMTDREARQFGNERMPFGKHSGERIDDIELDYLEWLADQPFNRELGRYLQSRRVKEEPQP